MRLPPELPRYGLARTPDWLTRPGAPSAAVRQSGVPGLCTDQGIRGHADIGIAIVLAAFPPGPWPAALFRHPYSPDPAVRSRPAYRSAPAHRSPDGAVPPDRTSGM